MGPTRRRIRAASTVAAARDAAAHPNHSMSMETALESGAQRGTTTTPLTVAHSSGQPVLMGIRPIRVFTAIGRSLEPSGYGEGRG